MVWVKEIFSSVQGEGLYVGEKQLFIRFCGCNLKCGYCDTDYSIRDAKNYTPIELANIVNGDSTEVVSLTGGEPLLNEEFLIEFISLLKNKKVYLETNGTLFSSKIFALCDVIAGDIKLKSVTGEVNKFDLNEKFFDLATKSGAEVFIKVVFDNKITDFEIDEVVKIASKNNLTIILQPKMPIEAPFYDVFEKFYKKYKLVRLICQTHKFLNLR